MSNPPKKDGFTIPSPATLAGSLASKLIRPADKLRDLKTRLGARQYRVKIVRARFPSGRRGVGPEVVIYEADVLPTPLVMDLSTLTEVITAVGRQEEGLVQVTEISGRYTEEFLLGVDPKGNQATADESAYWEIEFFRRDGQPSEKRRFIIQSAPSYKPTQFQWHVTLVNAIENRDRQGGPR